MSYKVDPKNKKSKGVEVFNIIPDDVRSRLGVLDLENEEDEESGNVDVSNIIPDNVCSRLEPIDLDDE